MAIAHHCLACGMDLAPVRADRTNPYGLPLVHCPRCRTVVVRRRDPLIRLWRQVRRTGLVLGRLAFNVAVLSGCTVLSAVAIAGAVAAIRNALWEPYDNHTPRWVAGLAAVALVVVGAAVRLVLGHHRPWKVWLGFTAWLVVFLVAIPTAAMLAESSPERMSADLRRVIADERTTLVALSVPAASALLA
ncbi:MAG: hypothetical protein KDA22_16175, partial [Phycisphaerales bacterium]|nr:hypothetical protein [Phycisphaerales bacterium]